MARARNVVRDLADEIRVGKVKGLVPPRGKKDIFPLHWHREDTSPPEVPDWIRWMWHPIKGTMYIGRVAHHYNFLPDRSKLSIWVRGFYFPAAKMIAVRTYFYPATPDECFNVNHGRIDDVVSGRIVKLLKAKLTRTKFVTGVDNDWLDSKFPRLCEW